MSFAVDPALDLARQVGNALEDEAAQPLADVQRAAPEGCDYFSELEASVSEWSFGYGVAWALARIRDPLLPSSTTGRIAEQAVRDAWRSFSGQSWTALMAEDRARRGPVEGDGAPASLEPVPPAQGSSPAPAEAGPPPAEESQYGDFMGKVARARPRRGLRPED
jgi:hypothetical protein